MEFKLAVLDVVEEVYLAAVTGASLGPPALLATRPTEGRVAAEQDVHHHSKTPQVTPFVIIKVTKLDWSETVIVHTEDILGLEVTMGDTLGVQKFLGSAVKDVFTVLVHL